MASCAAAVYAESILQIIEDQILIDAIGDIPGIHRFTLLWRLVRLDPTNAQAKKFKKRRQLLRIAARQVFIDRHHVHGDTRQRDSGCCQRAGKALALAGGHLRNVALQQRARANDLHRKVRHAEGAPTRFAN